MPSNVNGSCMNAAADQAKQVFEHLVTYSRLLDSGTPGTRCSKSCSVVRREGEAARREAAE